MYSKSAGSNKDLWGVDIQGRRGYVPQNFIVEYKTYQRDLQYELPTEFAPTATEPLIAVPADTAEKPKDEVVISDEKKIIEQPSPSVQPFEVIEGTKVFLPPNAIEEETEKEAPKIETPTPTPAQAEPVVPVPDKISEEIPTPAVAIETQTTPSPEIKQEDIPAKVENISSENVEQKSDEVVESSEDDYDDDESAEDDDDEEDDTEEEDEDDNKESVSIFANLAKMVEKAFIGDEEKLPETEGDSLSDDNSENLAKPIEDEVKNIVEETQKDGPILSMVPEVPKPTLFNLPVEETKKEVKDKEVVPEPILNQEKPKEAEK